MELDFTDWEIIVWDSFLFFLMIWIFEHFQQKFYLLYTFLYATYVARKWMLAICDIKHLQDECGKNANVKIDVW